MHRTNRPWRARALAVGVDPDPRFSMANERTFLGWIRTSLGMIALGVALATFVSASDGEGPRIVASALIALGGLLAAASWFRWVQIERAMRRGQGVPPSHLTPVVAVGVALIAVSSLVGIALTNGVSP